LAVIPTRAADAKHPLVRWGQIKRRPRRSTIERWASQFADANLAYLPEASDLVVVDIDDRSHEDRARRLLGIGETPLIIASGKRGLHFPLRTRQGLPSRDLRRFGIAGEIKAARSIVVAPGSIHPETGRAYQFLNGDWDAFLEVPWLNLAALEALIGRHAVEPEPALRSPLGQRNPIGRRNGSTFAHLLVLGEAGIFSSLSEVLAAAEIYNATHNDPPEPQHKVLATAKGVWGYIEKGTCKGPNTRHHASLLDAEHRALRTRKGGYADALALYLELKLSHGARAQRGETFAIAATAMAEAGTIPGWTDRKRYLRATKALLSCGLLERVEGAHLQRWTGPDQRRRVRGLRAAQYRFARGLS
jgi:hypothetical protein